MLNKTEEEAEHRRVLLRLASKGNREAREELEREYHACVYSAAQAARYIPKVSLPTLPAAVQRKVDGLLDMRNDCE
jgi:HEPN domain-containing protein